MSSLLLPYHLVLSTTVFVCHRPKINNVKVKGVKICLHRKLLGSLDNVENVTVAWSLPTGIQTHGIRTSPPTKSSSPSLPRSEGR